MSLCPFCHLTSQAWELERFVILYLSFSCLICQQMCSIWDFPFLCLCGPLGCQSQLRGHYWQFRRQGLSVGQSKVNLFCLGTQGEASSGEGVGLVNVDFDVHFQELSNLWLFALSCFMIFLWTKIEKVSVLLPFNCVNTWFNPDCPIDQKFPKSLLASNFFAGLIPSLMTT